MNIAHLLKSIPRVQLDQPLEEVQKRLLLPLFQPLIPTGTNLAVFSSLEWHSSSFHLMPDQYTIAAEGRS
jgi:hypothetical protein